MANTIILNLELPANLKHGWKKEVAGVLNIHQNTVTNALKAGNGETYNRIMQTAKNMYGKPVTPQPDDEEKSRCHI